ncbi:MAG: FeoB-associated Cys-rich membrane protein [Desulfobacterales bacterium]|nr:FeoB-associated Cys-rich membrane protein [Desulfobacterales bacterium]
MDLIIVGIIVIAAMIFSVRSFVKTYKGESGGSCGGGCSCSSRDSCSPDFPIANKK